MRVGAKEIGYKHSHGRTVVQASHEPNTILGNVNKYAAYQILDYLDAAPVYQTLGRYPASMATQ